MHHSPETHQQLVERIPTVTGKTLHEWHLVLDEGPSFIRPDERAAWLRDEHNIAAGFAHAIVHEHELRRHKH